MGMPVTNGLLWWYWPDAHGYVFEPLSIIMIGTALLCDLAYPFLLVYVKSAETTLLDGTVVATPAAEAAASSQKKRQ